MLQQQCFGEYVAHRVEAGGDDRDEAVGRLFERDARLQYTVALYTALTVGQYLLPLDPVTNIAIDALILWRLAPGIGRPTILH